jgi:hypothetical protein
MDRTRNICARVISARSKRAAKLLDAAQAFCARKELLRPARGTRPFTGSAALLSLSPMI